MRREAAIADVLLDTRMRLIRQPEGSELCGQACVAMAAGVSLKRSVEAFGHRRATSTREVVNALRHFGLSCADRLTRLSRARPNIPRRAIVVIHRPAVEGERRSKWHWMISWEGQIFDPGGRWPDGYDKWRITSYLEIYPT